MWKTFQHKFMAPMADQVPLHLQEAAQKMQLTIDRLESTANLKVGS